MSRNGQGTYVLPAGNPVVTGTVITSTWANTTMQDVATALTGSVASDGQTVITGNLQLGNNRITGMADGIAPQDAATVAQTTNVNIISGAINGAIIGNVNPPVGTFSSLTAPTLAIQDSSTKVATTRFVHDLVGAGGDLKIIFAFGATKTPAQLPATGIIPVNWDSQGNPSAQITFATGECAIYNLGSTSAPDYNDVYSYSGPTQSWVNIGPVEGAQGPVGPQGPAGAQGVQGVKGDTGAQGPAGAKGDTGNDGPQGIAGPQGPIGNTGPQGPAGEPAVLVGSFGASKTPADLPANGFIPANWDSPGNPATDEQLTIGQALVYSDAAPSAPKYGHVFSYVGTGFDADGWIDCGDIVGPQGVQGPQGIQGPQGNNGTDGQQGPQGIQGIKGDTGPQGVQGPQGPAGSDATVTSASVISALGFTPIPNDGAGATGTWSINISGNSTSCSGNAATATLAANATNANHATSADSATNATNATNATTAASCTGNSATATRANSAATADNGGVTSVNGQTGAVTISGGPSGIMGEVFTTAGTFTVPANVTAIKVTVVGGGGGGAGGGSVGGGGGTTSFGSLVSATGGAGSGFTNNTAVLGGIGQSGSINIRGGNGVVPTTRGTTSSGAASAGGFGMGGGSLYGSGAAGGFSNDGNILYCGGGGGGCAILYATGLTAGQQFAINIGSGGNAGSSSSGATAGSAGANGVCIVEW